MKNHSFALALMVLALNLFADEQWYLLPDSSMVWKNPTEVGMVNWLHVHGAKQVDSITTNTVPAATNVIDRALTEPAVYSNEVMFLQLYGKFVAIPDSGVSWSQTADQNFRAIKVYGDSLSGDSAAQVIRDGATLDHLYLTLWLTYVAQNWPWTAYTGVQLITNITPPVITVSTNWVLLK